MVRGCGFSWELQFRLKSQGKRPERSRPSVEADLSIEIGENSSDPAAKSGGGGRGIEAGNRLEFVVAAENDGKRGREIKGLIKL
jgi:hypothetical protein